MINKKELLIIFVLFAITSIPLLSEEDKNSIKSELVTVYKFDFGKNLEYYESIADSEGKEVIYLDNAKGKGSFIKSEIYSDGPYPIYYTCNVCECLIRIPKRCTCGRNNIPCAWIRDGWYKLERVDAQTVSVKEKLHSASIYKYAPKPLKSPKITKVKDTKSLKLRDFKKSKIKPQSMTNKSYSTTISKRSISKSKAPLRKSK